MNYYRFIIKTTESREEDIAFLLSERFGIDSIETRDNAFFDDSEREGGFFPELQPDLPYDDKSAEVLFYIENDGTKASEEKRDALLSDVKEILLENEKMPGWLYMSKMGATTIWESWEGTAAQGGIASLNHYSKGAVVEWLFSACCGIRIACCGIHAACCAIHVACHAIHVACHAVHSV